MLLALLSSSSAFANTPYVELLCRSNNHEIFADVAASSDCTSGFHIYGGNIKDVEIKQTSCDPSISVIYTEGAALAGTVTVSIKQDSLAMHLFSIEPVQTKPSGQPLTTSLLLFKARLVTSNWVSGRKVVTTTNVNCTGNSFGNP